jgi:hypothetical protein
VDFGCAGAAADLLIFLLISEISFTQRCRSPCESSRISERDQWK